ncbi:MAG: phage portal protein [Clostridiales Family XIII bacterium]|jgi:hypothetical protein|nr:phage portal protein [Clostridiales Family XIII bacterium]
MSNFSSFFKDSALKLENKKIVVSERFKDSKGKPEKWEIRPLSFREVTQLRAESQKKTSIKAGKRSASIDIPDDDKFRLKFAAAATVYPDLHDKALQDSYGAKGAEALLTEMLTSAEMDDYTDIVQQVSGYDMGLEDKVAEAKN